MKPPSWLPVGMLFLAAAFWGVCIPVMKALSTEQSLLFPEAGSLPASLASLCMRFALAGLAVAAAVRIAPRRLTRHELKHGVILGAITAASMFLQVDGLNYTSASTAGFLIALYCVLVPVLSWAFGWRRFTGILLACCALVLVGLGVLTGVTPEALGLGRGEWENLGAALLFAVQILWVARLPPGAFDPDRLTVVLCLTVAGLCALLLAAQRPGLETLLRIHASPRAFLITLFLALLGTAAPFVIMNRFQPRVDAVIAGFVYCIEPVATACGALFLPELLARAPSLYPNEPLTARVCLGGAFILAANLLLSRDKPAPAPVKRGE
jgi:drug/metabolite transporter (DMT)-like permease